MLIMRPYHAITFILFAGLLVAPLLLVLTSSGGRADDMSCYDQTPLPAFADIIAPPEDDTPEQISRFLGIWTDGRWSAYGFDDKHGHMCAKLVVSSVSKDGTASIIYSWGNSSEFDIQAGWSRWSGEITKISGDTIDLGTNRNGNSVSYVIDTSGPEPVLKGTYVGSEGGDFYVVLKRRK